MESRRTSRLTLGLVVAAVGVVACEPRDGALFNNCPFIVSIVGPSGAAVGDGVELGVNATDRDRGRLRYLWRTQDGGRLFPRDAAATTYHCESLGTKLLEVVVSDGQCDTIGATTLICSGRCGNGILEPDEECDPPVVGSCDTSCRRPAMVPRSCGECTATFCREEAPGCSSLADDPGRHALCVRLLACVRRTNCRAITGSKTACYCGAVPTTTCLGVDSAAGPCRAEVEAAAESTDPSVVAIRFNNPAYATGAVFNLLACEAESCGRVCPGP